MGVELAPGHVRRQAQPGGGTHDLTQPQRAEHRRQATGLAHGGGKRPAVGAAVHPVEQHPALPRPAAVAQHVRQRPRRLRAVGDQPHDPAGLERQRHVVQQHPPPTLHRDPLQPHLQPGLGRCAAQRSAVEYETKRPDAHPVPRRERGGLGDQLAVDRCAVGRLQVTDPHVLTRADHLGVMTGDQQAVQRRIAARVPAKRQPALGHVDDPLAFGRGRGVAGRGVFLGHRRLEGPQPRQRLADQALPRVVHPAIGRGVIGHGMVFKHLASSAARGVGRVHRVLDLIAGRVAAGGRDVLR